MRFSHTAATLAAAATLVAAQTYTNCNPTKKTCPNDIGLDSSSYSANFVNNPTANASWTAADYTTITYGNNGAEFSIAEQGQAPTISTDFYFFFGRVDVTMKAAPGTGIVSSIVFESDDLDEIDWEFLGGNTAQVETNFFGKGNTTVYDRAVYYSVTEPQSEFHTYTVDWTSERIAWIIDGVTVRTLAYTDPLTNGGKNYPQTPMRLKLGNWCGGCSGEAQGTIEWAGGNTTFNNAPYVMYVKSVAIQNYNPGSAYKYSDESGDWQSIEIVAGNGSKSSPTGSGSSAPATASATGVASNSSNHTSAPTSKVPVSAIQNTAAAVTSTVTGSSYSMNTASAFAANSVMTATTQVPSSPSSNVTSSATPAAQTGTNGAAIANAFTGVSLLSAVAAFFFL